jgi:hypothetical protein
MPAQNTDNDGNTLREVAQKISIRQEGNEVIDDLLKEQSMVYIHGKLLRPSQ